MHLKKINTPIKKSLRMTPSQFSRLVLYYKKVFSFYGEDHITLLHLLSHLSFTLIKINNIYGSVFIRCPLPPQSLQYALLEASVSCCTTPSSGDIQQWLQYHRLPSGDSGWVVYKIYIVTSKTLKSCWIFLLIYLVVFVSSICRRKSD